MGFNSGFKGLIYTQCILLVIFIVVIGKFNQWQKFLLSSAAEPTYREGAELACYVTVNRDTSCVLMKTLRAIYLRYFKFCHHTVDWQATMIAFGGIRRTGEAWPSERYHLPCARATEENHQTPQSGQSALPWQQNKLYAIMLGPAKVFLCTTIYQLQYKTPFLGSFAELRKAAISFVTFCLSARNISAPNGRIFVKFSI